MKKGHFRGASQPTLTQLSDDALGEERNPSTNDMLALDDAFISPSPLADVVNRDHSGLETTRVNAVGGLTAENMINTPTTNLFNNAAANAASVAVTNSLEHPNKSIHRTRPDYAIYPTSIRVNITNDTFMGRLSRPMWWIDGQFNQIPNKILSKNSVEIEIFSHYIDAPLVGILSFELTLDPRYQNLHHYGTAHNIHHMPVFDAFSIPMKEAIRQGKASAPYLYENMGYYQGPVPPWMVGPGGLIYVPPSVHKMYNLQQEFAEKQIEKIIDEYKNKDIDKQIKEQKREARVSKIVEKGVREHKKSLLKAMELLKKEKGETPLPETIEEESNQNTTTSKKKEEGEKEPAENALVGGSSTVKEISQEKKDQEEEDADMEDNDLEEDEDIEETEVIPDNEETDEFKPPKFRILLLWSVQPQPPPIPVQGADTQMLRQKRLSNVSMSTDVIQPNKFDVLLFEDDVDSEFNLDHSYFTQLEESALIADIQQKLVEHELFEISGTLGINRHNNQYQFVIDIDDGAGKWPYPPRDLYSDVFVPSYIHQSSSRTMPQYTKTSGSLLSSPMGQLSYDAARLAPHGNSGTPSQGNSSVSPRGDKSWRSGRASLAGKRVNSHTLSELVTQVDRDKERRSSINDNNNDKRQEQDLFEISVGDVVMLTEERKGQVKWIGEIDQNMIIGVRLVEPEGDSDGAYRGNRFFSSPPKYAVFVDRKELVRVLKDEKLDYLNEEFEKDQKTKMLEAAGSIRSIWNTNTYEAERLNESMFVGLSQNSGVDETMSKKIWSKASNSKGDLGLLEFNEFYNTLRREAGQGPVSLSEAKRPSLLSNTKLTSTSMKSLKDLKNLPSVPANTGRVEDVLRRDPNRNSGEKGRERSDSQRSGNLRLAGGGGGPRTVVFRKKMIDIQEHPGMIPIREAIEAQNQQKYKLALQKYKLGISMLEVALNDIDRGVIKRQWKQEIEEYRHRMHRCTFEIDNLARNKFLAQQEAKRRKEAKEQLLEDDKKSKKRMEAAVAETNIEINELFKGQTDEKLHDVNADSDPEKSVAEEWQEQNKELGYMDKNKPVNQNDKWKGKRSPKASDIDIPKSKGKDEDTDNRGKEKNKEVDKHDKALMDKLSDDMIIDKPNVFFREVIGLEMVKLALYENIILPQQRPDLFASVRKPCTGLLLFGPPGNGKTMIAKCVASEINCTFFSISASSITSKFVGEAERTMRHLFRMARERAPSIIFIDEIDSLLTARGGSNEGEASRRVKTEFLVQFDGVLGSKDSEASITVIGATNLPHQLDEAVLRRFPKRIMVPNPDRAARYSLLRLMTRKHDHALTEEHFQMLADGTENYSSSDLTMLCNDALMGPLREAMISTDLTKASRSEIPQLSFRHFQQSLNNIRASVPPQSIQHYFDWDKQFGSSLFLTVDVLPDSMRSGTLISVEEERRLYKEEHNKNEEKEKEKEMNDTNVGDQGISDMDISRTVSMASKSDESITSKETESDTTENTASGHVKRKSAANISVKSKKRSSTAFIKTATVKKS